MSKIKVFVSAYACEPNRGSEIGVGWNWVLQMSEYFELWVLTRKSNKRSIEEWIRKSDNKNDIHFVYYDLPRALSFWKKGLRGVRLYYNMWQIASNKIVENTMKNNGIEIYHLLTYGNSLWKVSNYGMNQFFVWGPTGGVDYISNKFTAYYGIKFKVREAIRRLVINTLPFNYGFKKKCKKAKIIFCKSESMYKAIPEKYREKAKLFTDCAVNEQLISKPEERQREKVCFITVGRLDAWRNYDVLIEAFTKAYNKNKNITLKIVGTGNDEHRLKSLIGIRGMSDTIEMPGEVEIEEYIKLMKDADVVVNPAYKESAVTMSFDSMALSKPLICIETGGYTKNFNEEGAIIIKQGTREKMIEDISQALLEMSDSSTRWYKANKTYELACKNTWANKGKEICKEIMSVYERYNK